MKVVEACKILCKRDYTAAELAIFADKIDDDYRVHWMLDNLPAATKYYVEIVDATNPSASPVYQPRYEKGFSLGFVGSEKIPRTTPGMSFLSFPFLESFYFIIIVLIRCDVHQQPRASDCSRARGRCSVCRFSRCRL